MFEMVILMVGIFFDVFFMGFAANFHRGLGADSSIVCLFS
jgi:hypothetical protein